MYDETACIQDYGSQDPQKAQLEYQSLNEFKDEQERPSRPYLKGFLAGVILAALLVIILACAGVFSSGSSDDCTNGKCDLKKIVKEICKDSKDECGVYGTEVRIFNTPVGLTAPALAHAVKHSSWVTDVTLKNAQIGNRGAVDMANAVKSHPAITTLRMALDSISAQGACAVGDMMSQNKILQNLDLNQNAVENDGARCIASGVKANGNLIYLNLWKNKIGEQGALDFAASFKVNMVLRTLILSDNAINNGDAGSKALHAAEDERKKEGGELDITWESN